MLERLGCSPAVVEARPGGPGFSELIGQVQHDQLVVISELAALGASASEIASRLADVLERGAVVSVLQEGIDTRRDGLVPLMRHLGALRSHYARGALARADEPAVASGRRAMRYRDDEIAALWEKRDAGWSWTKIARWLGRKPEAVRQLCKRRGRPEEG